MEDPVFAGTPSDISQNTDANSPTATVTWTPPTTSDNAGEGETVTSDHSPGDTFPIGTTTVTYTATDPYGNSATTSFDVVITGKNGDLMSNKHTKTPKPLVSFCTFIIIYSRPNVGSA